MKILVIFSHTYQDQSVSGKAALEVFKKTEGVVVRNIEELYPNLDKIDVAAEQQALVDADLVLFYHPIFWFNVPSGLKRYMDDVLQYGFAYGTGGDKLHGKKFAHVYTTGSGAETYVGGLHETLEAPLHASAEYCGMKYVKAYPLYGQLALTNPNAAELAKAHVEKVLAELKAL